MGRRCTYGMPEKECLGQEAGQLYYELYYEDDEGNRHVLGTGLMETELAASVCPEEDPVFTNIRWFAPEPVELALTLSSSCALGTWVCRYNCNNWRKMHGIPMISRKYERRKLRRLRKEGH